MTGTRDGALFLAMDTSTSRGSVAVGPPGEALWRIFLERQGAHASDLIPAVRAALEVAGVDIREIEGILVGAGPGSFTGVRVAAATAKGLARALEIPLWAFSSLAAGAATADVLSPAAAGVAPVEASLPYGGLDALPRCVLFDARGDRVYAACYRFREGEAPEVLMTPRATDITWVLQAAEARLGGVAFAGDGAQRHQDRIRDSGFPVMGPPAGSPTGDGLLRLLALDPHTPPLERPGRWEPQYLRASNAERERPT